MLIAKVGAKEGRTTEAIERYRELYRRYPAATDFARALGALYFAESR